MTPETIVYASPVMPMSGYRLSGSVDGVDISLLLDTGAAVTLLRADTWSQVATKTQQGLQPWSMARLVSAGGTPLTVQGRRKAFKSEGALALAEGQSPLGGLGGMLPRKILRFDIVRDRI